MRALAPIAVLALGLAACSGEARAPDRGLRPTDAGPVDAGVAALKEAMAGTNHRLIEDRTQKLDEMSAEFAVRRMNKSISEALEGQRADDISRPTA